MIEPFSSSQVADGTISYGLSSYGYDLRLADEFKIFNPPRDVVLNPKAIPPEYYRDYRGAFCDIPPNGYVLGRTVEYLRILAERRRLKAELDATLDGFDALLTPTTPSPAIPVTECDQRVAPMSRLTRAGTADNIPNAVKENLPSINRSLADIVRINPLFNTFGGSSGADTATVVAVAGNSYRYNSLQIDGATNGDAEGDRARREAGRARRR